MDGRTNEFQQVANIMPPPGSLAWRGFKITILHCIIIRTEISAVTIRKAIATYRRLMMIGTWKALTSGLFVLYNGPDQSVGVVVALLILVDPVSKLAAGIRHSPSTVWTVRHLRHVHPHRSVTTTGVQARMAWLYSGFGGGAEDTARAREFRRRVPNVGVFCVVRRGHQLSLVW